MSIHKLCQNCVISGGCLRFWYLEQIIGQNTQTKQGMNEATKAIIENESALHRMRAGPSVGAQ